MVEESRNQAIPRQSAVTADRFFRVGTFKTCGLPLHATGEGAERGTAPQHVAPGRYYIIDLVR